MVLTTAASAADGAQTCVQLIQAQRLREFTGERWPSVSEMREKHWLLRHQLDYKKACRGEYSHRLLVVSHRWESAAHPDPHGRQLRAIRDLLLDDDE